MSLHVRARGLSRDFSFWVLFVFREKKMVLLFLFVKPHLPQKMDDDDDDD